MFPYSEIIKIENDFDLHYSKVIENLESILTPERQSKINEVVQKRCFDIAVVLEGIYDRGNASAVMRTGEGLGFANFHMIETQEKFKEANRVTQGADKWVEVSKWKSTKSCIDLLKSQKKQIVVTALTPKAVPISEVDFTKPSALVLGNEKSGVTPEMLEAADHVVILPMDGFVQSFNISVAGALCLYHIQQNRLKNGRHFGDLSAIQMEILKAHYILRTLTSGPDILRRAEIKR